MTEYSEAFETPTLECPTCHARLTGAFSVASSSIKAPVTGSLGVCVYCLGCHEWTSATTARVIKFMEMIKLTKNDKKKAEIARAYCALADLHAEWVRSGKIKLITDAIPEG